jgi:ribosomal protein S18 acetylase RimI-like enzyme
MQCGVVVDSYFFPIFKTHHLPNQSQQRKTICCLNIRPAQEKDLKSLADVLVKGFPPISNWLNPILRLGVYEDIKSRLVYNLPYYNCFVAANTCQSNDQEIVGTVEIAYRPISIFGQCMPYISNLTVIPNFRKQGIAHKLLECCEQSVVEWGFKEIWLHVLENNQAAQHLYQKRGYSISKIETDWSNLIFQQPKKILLYKKL